MKLLGLDKNSFPSWWAKLPEGSTMVVQPKIKGFSIGLRYKYGQLVDAFSREESVITENIRKIKAIPLNIDDSLKVEVELEGVLYSPFCDFKFSTEKLLSSSIPKNVSNSPMSFLAFQIFRSNSDELSDLTQLQNWGFEIPITLRTHDPKQVKRWHSQWLRNELFSNFPTNGIVAKCNSSLTKNTLGVNQYSPNWALALTR